MLSIPPAMTTLCSPNRTLDAARITARRDEPQTIFTVTQEVVTGNPASSATRRAGACPTPAGSTCLINFIDNPSEEIETNTMTQFLYCCNAQIYGCKR